MRRIQYTRPEMARRAMMPTTGPAIQALDDDEEEGIEEEGVVDADAEYVSRWSLPSHRRRRAYRMFDLSIVIYLGYSNC